MKRVTHAQSPSVDKESLLLVEAGYVCRCWVNSGLLSLREYRLFLSHLCYPNNVARLWDRLADKTID